MESIGPLMNRDKILNNITSTSKTIYKDIYMLLSTDKM